MEQHYDIETGFTMGLRGSGKTYDLACRVNEKFLDGRVVHTINMDLRKDLIQRRMMNAGWNAYDSGRLLGKSEKIWTLGHFSRVRNCFLAVDEGHFWFPQSQYMKISLETVLDMAMGRKRRVDMWAVSQLDKSINHNVRDLLEDGWVARPLNDGPLWLWARLTKRMGLSAGRAFFYVRYHDAFGATEKRKDGTARAEDKRIRFLDPSIAATYRTEQEVSSPILDRMRDDARDEYLKSLLNGVKAQADCPVCHGHKEVTGALYPIEVPDPAAPMGFRAELHFQPMGEEELDRTLVLNIFAKREVRPCEWCGGKGYHYPEDHPDYEEARLMLERVGRLRAAAGAGRAP